MGTSVKELKVGGSMSEHVHCRGLKCLRGFVNTLYFVFLRDGLGMPSRRVRDDCKEFYGIIVNDGDNSARCG